MKKEPAQGRPSTLLAMTQKDHMAYTRLALKSLRDRVNLDILIVDDGSKGVEDEDFGDVDVVYLENLGIGEAWNQAYAAARDGRYEYLVISNNDVVFMPGWLDPLIYAFQEDGCGISGPMTNQPGHQRHQLVPVNDPIEFSEMAKRQVKAPTGNGYRLNFVNGFCFCLKMDRVALLPDGMPFAKELKDYGTEDEYQIRMRDDLGLVGYAMQDSMVYHYKDVSFESWRVGRLPFNTLPPRLASDKDYSGNPEEVASGSH